MDENHLISSIAATSSSSKRARSPNFVLEEQEEEEEEKRRREEGPSASNHSRVDKTRTSSSSSSSSRTGSGGKMRAQAKQISATTFSTAPATLAAGRWARNGKAAAAMAPSDLGGASRRQRMVSAALGGPKCLRRAQRSPSARLGLEHGDALAVNSNKHQKHNQTLHHLHEQRQETDNNNNNNNHDHHHHHHPLHLHHHRKQQQQHQQQRKQQQRLHLDHCHTEWRRPSGRPAAELLFALRAAAILACLMAASLGHCASVASPAGQGATKQPVEAHQNPHHSQHLQHHHNHDHHDHHHHHQQQQQQQRQNQHEPLFHNDQQQQHRSLDRAQPSRLSGSDLRAARASADEQQRQHHLAKMIQEARLLASTRRAELKQLGNLSSEQAEAKEEQRVDDDDDDEQERESLLLVLGGAEPRPASLGRLAKRSGISDQRLAEIQMIRALKKQLERATKLAVEPNSGGSGENGASSQQQTSN